jgi:mRNA-degrading endonuclease YafQ of YafQ-DinJ toxin-antitoxin module
MKKDFDDILREGKSKVGSEDTPLQKWKKEIHRIMESLHAVNELYDDNKKHHLQIEQNNCDACKVASFVLTVRDFKNQKKIVRFHQSKWKVVKKGVYRCKKCSKEK